MSAEGIRDDILVSVCFSDAEAPGLARERIAEVAEQLGASFRYWEILVVNTAGHEADFEETLMAQPNLRYLSVLRGLDENQRRVVAASEAIGDVVVLTSVHEVGAMNLPEMIRSAEDHGAVVFGQRPATAIVEPLIVALGKASGFEASTRDMQTVAYPRTVLNRLLSGPNTVLALRFPPRDKTVQVLRRAPTKPLVGFRRRGDRSSRLSSRLDLLMRMVTDAGPTLLGVVAAMSAAMFVGAILFAVYVLVVNLTLETVAEGWTTLSLAIAGMLGFLGAALFGICITLRKMAEVVRGRAVDHIVSERSSVDLFASVANSLNVEMDHADGEASARSGG